MTEVRTCRASLRRPLASRSVLALAAVGAAVCSSWLRSDDEHAFVQGIRTPVARNPAVALAAETWELEVPDVKNDSVHIQTIKRPYIGTARYARYRDFVWSKKPQVGIHIRFARKGNSHAPHYKIQAAFAPQKQPTNEVYLENLGWYDPLKKLSSKKSFCINADRAVYWLRQGAKPTNAVATILDFIGLIRRTGPNSKNGEWEWRIDKYSGPEAPPGWEWNGVQTVRWNTNPRRFRSLKEKKKNRKKREKVRGGRPAIEKYGFKGYQKIPIDFDTMTEPLGADKLTKTFSNTDIPIF